MQYGFTIEFPVIPVLQLERLFDLILMLIAHGFKLHIQTTASVFCSPIIPSPSQVSLLSNNLGFFDTGESLSFTDVAEDLLFLC